MGFAIMFIWMAMIIFTGDWIYAFHSKLWQMDQFIQKQLFMSANLIGIGMWKMGIFLFFAIPWLAMKIVGNNNS
jgi:hypothetical protein